MSSLLKTIAALVTGGIIATSALAQAAGQARPNEIVMPEAGAFEALSQKNKKIAETIFNRQIVTADGKAPLSLDQIAAANRRGGWGKLFQQMKADGLTRAKNLRQFVSGRSGNRSFRGRGSHRGSPGTTIVTMASGGQIIFDRKIASNRSTQPGYQRVIRAGDFGSSGKARYSHSYQSSNGRMVYRGRLHSAAIMGH